MKKITFLIIAAFAIGCSSDDAPATVAPVEYFYSISITEVCPSEERIRYCVIKEVHDNEKAEAADFRQSFPNEQCVPAQFIDIDGIQRLGHYITTDRWTTNPCAED